MQLIIQRIAQAAVDFLNAEHPKLEEGNDILNHFVNLGEYVLSPLPTASIDHPGSKIIDSLEHRIAGLEDAVGMFLQDRKEVDEIKASCDRLAKPLPSPSTSFTTLIFDGFENVQVNGFEWGNLAYYKPVCF